jgi:hypothetical protein
MPPKLSALLSAECVLLTRPRSLAISPVGTDTCSQRTYVHGSHHEVGLYRGCGATCMRAGGSPVLRGSDGVLGGYHSDTHAPESVDQTRALFHAPTARMPCMLTRALFVRLCSLCVPSAQRRLLSVHSELGPCRRGRGGSWLGIWGARHLRAHAASAHVDEALGWLLAVGSKTTEVAPLAALRLRALSRSSGVQPLTANARRARHAECMEVAVRHGRLAVDERPRGPRLVRQRSKQATDWARWAAPPQCKSRGQRPKITKVFRVLLREHQSKSSSTCLLRKQIL